MRSDADRNRFVLLYLALAPLYLAPLFATRFLPAYDLPHHLAIVDALRKSGTADSPYAARFVVGLELAPFVAHLVVLQALATVMSIGAAAKVLVGAVVLTLPIVTARFLSVSGRSRVPAVIAFPLAYSMPLHFGLIAFVMAMPILVWMIAEACNQAGWRDRPALRAASLGVLSLAAFCTHLEAWGVGAVAAAAAILLNQTPWRTRLVGLASLGPSLLLCVLYLARTIRDPLFASRPSFLRALLTARLQELAERGVTADLWGRVQVAPIHLLRGFNDGSDVLAAKILFAAIAVGLIVGLIDWTRRWPWRRPSLTPAAAVVLVVLLAYFGLPHHAPPDAHSVYPRFAVVLALLLLTAVPPVLSRPGPPAYGLAALLAVALSVYGLSLLQHYAAFGRELEDFEQVLDASPPGLGAGGLVFDAESAVVNVDGIFSGVPEYYVTDRPSPATWTWLYYCDTPQMPCHARDAQLQPLLPHFGTPSQFNPEAALRDLQVLFVRGGPGGEVIFGAEWPRVRLLVEHGRWRAFTRVDGPR